MQLTLKKPRNSLQNGAFHPLATLARSVDSGCHFALDLRIMETIRAVLSVFDGMQPMFHTN